MTPLTRLVTLAVLPVAVLISLTHLVEADQGPGDGFTAGIISSLGLTLQYVTFGYAEARRLFRHIPYQVILLSGLSVAIFAALLPVFFGRELLAIQESVLRMPILGEVRLTRAMLFDLGIYLTVFGGSMTAIDSLGRVIE